MTGTRSRPATSTASSLMQDVPGTFPTENTAQLDDGDTPYVTLPQAVHARRAEYVEARHVRIKIGTWNVAAYKGTEKDVGAWFVQGKGIAEALAGFQVNGQDEREDVAAQEARYARKQPTVPLGDAGGLPGMDDVGLYVLGLQEVVDIGSVTEALRPFTDPGVSITWKTAMVDALPVGYQLVAEQQLIGMLLLIFASPTIAGDIRSVSTTSVGSGIGGFMGNKGAVTARLVLGDTTRLVFVNSHLSSGADKASLERRNWDAHQILQRTRFEPIQDAMDLHQTTGEAIGDEDVAFWMGDLNYRLEGIPGHDVRRLLMLHTRNEYDLSQRSARKIENELKASTAAMKRIEERFSIDSSGSSSTASARRSSEDTSAGTDSTAPTLTDEVAASDDPTSLATTLSSLLPHDELHQQMRARKAFHDGWKEGPITFLPTYKYDAGSVGVFDSSEKKRAPSWCDRILYRTRRDRLAYEVKMMTEESARKKDEEMRADGTDEAGNDEEILYDYDPDNDAADPNGDYDDDVNEGLVVTKEGFEDEIQLEYYVAHQRVLSSDHKPLDAAFLLKYDSVVPELKAKVQVQVARELDRTENENRPSVTVVVDKHHDDDIETSDADPGTFEGVWFGKVRWANSKHRTITIANTSRVSASFSFISRPVPPGEPSGVAPKWLNLSINDGTVASTSEASVHTALQPGDSCTVELELRILDMHAVHQLNDGAKTLDDILVLRVQGGRDHFIPIRGQWQDTSLGRSIDKLARIPETGVRWLQQQKPVSSKTGSLRRSRHGTSASSSKTDVSSPVEAAGVENEHPVRFSAPRELFRLTGAVEELVTRFVAEWDMTHANSVELAYDYEAPPWEQRPGWPFDKACWTERHSAQWVEASGNAANALDTNQALIQKEMTELPISQQLYVLASLLLLFLSTLPDGVITEQLWAHIEAYFSELERLKRAIPTTTVRDSLMVVLAREAAHSISFMLIIAMLDRISHETSRVQAREDMLLKSPMRQGGTLRKMTALKRPPLEFVRDTDSPTLAQILGDVAIRTPKAMSDKARKTAERRKIEFMDAFLSKDSARRFERSL